MRIERQKWRVVVLALHISPRHWQAKKASVVAGKFSVKYALLQVSLFVFEVQNTLVPSERRFTFPLRSWQPDAPAADDTVTRSSNRRMG